MVDHAAPLESDSRAAIQLIDKGAMSNRTKHLRIAFHEVLGAVTGGKVILSHVPGADNASDILTKPLDRHTHEKHTASLLNDLKLYKYNVKLLSKWEHGKQWE